MQLSLSTLLVAATFLVATANGQAAAPKNPALHVAIYYEVLCPDSINFVTNQLVPAYQGLKDYIDILFVPFGKARSVNGGDDGFVCQHGPQECSGNKLQSCGLYSLSGQPDEKVNFVGCQMQFGADLSGQSCAVQQGISWYWMLECYEYGLGLQLQLEAERLTQAVEYPYPSFVPTIVYNEQFDQVLQDRSLTDFNGVVCDLIHNVAPGCAHRI